MNIKASLLLFFCLLSGFRVLCQQTSAALNEAYLVNEGKTIYRSERASWYATDIISLDSARYKTISGYFSYPVNGSEKCIFYSNADSPIVMASVTFDQDFSNLGTVTKFENRGFTKAEFDIYSIREKAIHIIKTDTIFKLYENTNLNIVPIVTPMEKNVYVLTAPKKNGVIIFGNDYLLKFNSRDSLISKIRLHRDIITINYHFPKDTTGLADFSVHDHSEGTSEFITPTDICTLMLYEKFTNWKTHFVISAGHVSIWNCKTNSLLTMPRKVFKNIYKNPDSAY